MNENNLPELGLIDEHGQSFTYTLKGPGDFTRPLAPFVSRKVYAAAHVIPQMGANNTPGAPAIIDWDATLAYRHELWSYGLGVADAMDTAQRGMGLDYAATCELITRSAHEAATVIAENRYPALGGLTVRDILACGVGTDQLTVNSIKPGQLQLVTDAYLEMLRLVEGSGSKSIVMCSRALAKAARNSHDYLQVYSTVLEAAQEPVILHWLGEMFDPELAGYWGTTDLAEATSIFQSILDKYAHKIDGVKVSLLDAEHEKQLRAALPAGVRLYTGDDFNYPELIEGDGELHSDALLGIFAAIYPAASTAMQAFDAEDSQRGRAILDSTRELGLHIFSAPTLYYKTGIAFLSWLNGHQAGFQMIGGLQAGRSLPHLIRTFVLADTAGLLLNPHLAAERMEQLLAVYGVNVTTQTLTGVS
ncbi:MULTISPECIES: dihydrodipicolinate synthase family protein [Micrococcaceae]|uniref:dihydrodipicolinate synthase family protein n=1 Tax=Micrococcaceae TaxID=1268 RepID=UPI0010355AD1|nr:MULTISPECIES: dihydrodipicolinate synthase family protein [Micrococcaceae]TAP28789.1 dihydrodipicolinate synthase family protein [Arthrobacter sp. S41]UXN32368.1 dihydrodipicolinate synthase family protein [Glutamicibacter sp. M10]